MSTKCPTPFALFLQACGHSGSWWSLVEVCKQLGTLCTSPARDQASTSEVTMCCGTARHLLAGLSGCPSSMHLVIQKTTAKWWRAEPMSPGTIPSPRLICHFMPCCPRTQPATSLLFTQGQEIQLSFSRNLLPLPFLCALLPQRTRRGNRTIFPC